jgi:hypothetical protein
MRNLLKNILLKLPYGKNILHYFRFYGGKFYYWKLLKFKKFRNAEERFTYYYKNNIWKSEESVSGLGSTIHFTENIRRELPEVFKKFQIKKILDAPCGDYNWFRLIERNDEIIYTGGDIVKPLIDDNNNKYQNFNTNFIQLDITCDKLPAADLWLCRDVLFHFSNQDIKKAIFNFLNSEIDFILTTTYPRTEVNNDIQTGLFRELNLEIEPFNFGRPILIIEDSVDRKVSLWDRRTLSKTLSANKFYAPIINSQQKKAS